MALADYCLCDVCGGKAFYDVNLNYTNGVLQADGSWKHPETAFRVAGETVLYGTALDYLGDWAVLCIECAKTHRTQIVPIDAAMETPHG